MNEKDLHDIKNSLNRLEIMADLLRRQDFSTFSEAEIKQDATLELEKLHKLLLGN